MVGLERRGRASYSQADAREGHDDVGGGVVERGLGDRLAEIASAPGFRDPPAPVGCGANPLVALSEQEDEQGLREAVRLR